MGDISISKLSYWILVLHCLLTEHGCEDCPERCDCSPSEGSDPVTPLVTCDGIFPSNMHEAVNQLIIRNANKFTVTHNDTSSLGRLTSLEITTSCISSVEGNAFSAENILNLKTLLLSDNEISVLDDHIFAELQELEELFLDRNNFKNITVVFRELEKLKVLHLESNYLEDIPSDFPPTLNELYLSDNSIHTVIFWGTFYRSLRHLDLCGNSYAGLSHEDMSIPYNLNDLCLGSQFYDIDPSIFSSNGRSLQTLTLRTTKKLTIRTLDAINKLYQLRTLTISGAKVVKLSNTTFNDLQNLQSLSLLNMQCAPNIDENFFGFRSLTELDLSNSPYITKIALSGKVFLEKLKKLKVLKLGSTSFSVIGDDMVPIFQRLEQLDVSHNKLICDCNLESIRHNSFARKLDLLHLEDTRCFQESTRETHFILDKRLKISDCNTPEDRQPKSIGGGGDGDSTSSTTTTNNLFYIVICLIIVIVVMFIVIFYMLVKYLKATRKYRRSTISTIF